MGEGKRGAGRGKGKEREGIEGRDFAGPIKIRLLRPCRIMIFMLPAIQTAIGYNKAIWQNVTRMMRICIY